MSVVATMIGVGVWTLQNAVAQPENALPSPLLMIVIGVAAVGVGVLLGLPGGDARRVRRGGRIGAHDEQEIQELEQRLGRRARQSQTTKRQFTPLDWLRRDPRASQRRRSGRYFRTVAPAEKGKEGDG